ncbi:MAG: S1 RNA-binding domain-containing protein [Anaerolineae bacterium]|nr:S1 RNA-binding domain-containing protein [Anaerolineae bacterium]
MSIDAHRYDYIPPPLTLDEGYWMALLQEGENATSVPHHDEFAPHFTRFDDDMADSIDAGHHGLYHHESSEDWEAIETIFSSDEVIEVMVVGYNRGGLLVEWHSLRGFVPASQLINFPATSNQIIRRNALMNRVGEIMHLRVIELLLEKNRLILSERAAQASPGERANILHTLQAGDIVEGIVTNLCDFGAFVDLGGLEGLVHISELSWGRVGHPENILTRGQSLRAYVLGVDQEASRIALSLKRLRPDPWKTVQDRYLVGQVVEGIITNVVDFGAFACIEEGLEGLIHVSELAEGHFLHPRNVVKEGQYIRARILNINGAARRLGLSLRLEE